MSVESQDWIKIDLFSHWYNESRVCVYIYIDTYTNYLKI